MSKPLAVRMVLVAVLNPLIAVGLLAAVVVFMPSTYRLGLLLGLTVGASARWIRRQRRRGPEGRTLSESDDSDLFAIVDRLCALADVRRPQLVLSEQRQPNSWVVHVPGQQPRLYLTRGLRETLTPEELQAVLGHELAHIANRDALVMTVVGAPGALMRQAGAAGGLDAVLAAMIGALSHLGVAILSRYREFAADAGGSAITGRPSALASALIKVSGSLTQIPQEDLRAAAALNAFNLVPVPSRSRLVQRSPLLARMIATHPPLRARLDALEALERAQQRPGL